MPLPADVQIRLRVGAGAPNQRGRSWSGESVPIAAEFLTVAGQPLTPEGVTVEVWGPDLEPIATPIQADSASVWRAQVLTVLPGRYRVWVRCAGPTAAVGYVEFDAIGVGAPTPDALAVGMADMLSRAAQAGAAAARARTPLSILDFYAVGDGVTDDTDAVQAAVNEAVASGRMLIVPDGTYKLCVKPLPLHIYDNYAQLGSNVQVYAAVRLLGSGLRMVGQGGRFVMGHTPGMPPLGVSYMFATDKNMTLGAVQDLEFDGLTFDFDTAYGAKPPNPRALYIVGCDGLRLSNLFQTTGGAGARQAGTITVRNSRDVRVRGHRQYRTNQGFNWAYVDDWSMLDCRFQNFSEAIDFNHYVTDGIANDVRFQDALQGSAYTGQCWDLNSVQRMVAAGISAENVGNLFWVNYKPYTFATFAEYVASGTTTYNPDLASVTSRDISLRGVRGTNVGNDPAGNGVAWIIGNDRTTDSYWAGGPPVERITLEDVRLDSSGIGIVYEGTDILLRRLKMQDVVGIDNSSFGAITAMQQRDSANATVITDSRLSITMDDVEVEDAGSIGILIDAPERADLRNVRVSGYNGDGYTGTQYGIWLRNLDLKAAQVTLEDIASSGGAASPAPTALRLQDAGGAGYSVEMRGRMRLGGDTPLLISRASVMRPTARLTLGAMDARSLAASNPDTTAETMDLSAADWASVATGMLVSPRNSGGSLPSGLSAGNYYHLVRSTTSPLVAFADSALAAFAGTPLRNLTTAGTGSHILDLARFETLFLAQGAAQFLGLRAVAGRAITADATNKATLAIRRYRAGAPVTIATFSLAAAVMQGAVVWETIWPFNTPANADLIAGDALVFLAQGSGGTGVFIPALMVEIVVLPRG